jgi:hypothetical protein
VPAAWIETLLAAIPRQLETRLNQEYKVKKHPSTKSAAKPNVKVSDLKPEKNPKGGAQDIFIQKVVDKSSPVLFRP